MQTQPINWEEKYQKGETFWDKGYASPPMRQFLQRAQLTGRAILPGCGRGHEVALATEFGLEATGLDISPTAIAEACSRYPDLKERFVVADLFNPPPEICGTFDLVLEHTCMSALPPSLRPSYRRGIDLLLRPGGLLVGVWFINPARDSEHLGPPFSFPVEELDSLFASGYEIIEDYVPDVAFEGREGRERLRVLKRQLD